MSKNGEPSGQSWGTFLRNHMPHIAAMDLFLVPTIGFIQLYVLVIVRLARRELVSINVTAHPTSEWIAQRKYAAYYNVSRIHRSLNRDAPFHWPIERVGAITSRPVLGGLHHQYCRI
jgi:hypothetical protein